MERSIVDQLADLPRESLAKLLVDVLELNRLLRKEIALARPKSMIVVAIGKSYMRGKYHVALRESAAGSTKIHVGVCGATLWARSRQYEFSGTWESLREHIAREPEDDWCMRCRNYVFDQEVKARAY